MNTVALLSEKQALRPRALNYTDLTEITNIL